MNFKLILVVMVLAISVGLVSSERFYDTYFWNETFEENLTRYYTGENITEVIFGNFNMSYYEGTGGIYSSANCIIGSCFIITENNNFRTAYDYDLNLSQGGKTISFWFTYSAIPIGGGHSGTLIAKAEGSNVNQRMQFYYEYLNERIEVSRINSTVTDVYIDDVSTPFNMITLVTNETSFSLYHNGTLQDRGDINPNYSSADNPLDIGTLGGASDMLDTLYFDELSVYNKSLTDNEVELLYNDGLGRSPGSELILETTYINWVNTTFEGVSNEFILNVTYNSTRYPDSVGYLVYNNTNYLATEVGTGDSISFVVDIDSPYINKDSVIDFFWNITLINESTDYSYYGLSTHNQTVNRILFTRCNVTYSSPIYVNYSIYDETSLTLLNASMKSTFEYRLEGATETKNYSIDSEGNETFQFCTNTNETFIVDAAISLSSTNYNDRTYHLKNVSYTNESITHTDFYLLSGTNGTNIIIEVKDPGLQPLEGYFVDIQRYYPGTNEYRTIISEETDEFGQFVARLIENTMKYKFIFKNPSGTIVKTTGDITIACRTTICIIPFVVEDTTDDFERFSNITDFEWSLTFDNNTNIFTFSWNDNTGIGSTQRLLVERFSFNSTGVVCNLSSTASASSLTCDVGSTSSNYRGQIFRKASGEDEKRLGLLNVKVGDLADTFGLEGFLWSFMLLFTLIAIGSFNPTVGVVLYMVGFIVLGAVGIISVSPAIFFAQLVIGILFIWAFRS